MSQPTADNCCVTAGNTINCDNTTVDNTSAGNSGQQMRWIITGGNNRCHYQLRQQCDTNVTPVATTVESTMASGGSYHTAIPVITSVDIVDTCVDLPSTVTTHAILWPLAWTLLGTRKRLVDTCPLSVASEVLFVARHFHLEFVGFIRPEKMCMRMSRVLDKPGKRKLEWETWVVGIGVTGALSDPQSVSTHLVGAWRSSRRSLCWGLC